MDTQQSNQIKLSIVCIIQKYFQSYHAKISARARSVEQQAVENVTKIGCSLLPIQSRRRLQSLHAEGYGGNSRKQQVNDEKDIKSAMISWVYDMTILASRAMVKRSAWYPRSRVRTWAFHGFTDACCMHSPLLLNELEAKTFFFDIIM